MKEFLPTYLYVKTNNITGLKYFGKTTKSDPFSYRGSGTYWVNHCNKYGWNISTHIVGFYTNKDDCISAAVKFSEDNDIVNDKDSYGKKVWANAIAENGIDGGATITGKPRSEETRTKISNSLKGRLIKPEWIEKSKLTKGCGYTLSEEHKKAISIGQNKPSTVEAKRLANIGKKHSQETITKRSKSNTGKVRSNDTRNNISKGRMGIKFSTEHIQKLKDRVVTEETKTKIRLARSKQVFTEETKIKLSGCVVVVDNTGFTSKITKSEYELQKLIPFEESQYVAHRSKEGIRRISMRR